MVQFHICVWKYSSLSVIREFVRFCAVSCIFCEVVYVGLRPGEVRVTFVFCDVV